MKNWIIGVLVGLLMLSIILSATLGPKNAYPDPKDRTVHVMLINTDAAKFKWVDTYPWEEQGSRNLSVQVVLNDEDLRALVAPTPTPPPTPSPTPSPTPTVVPTTTPTPTPKYTGIRKYIEDRRYIESPCNEQYLVRGATPQDICIDAVWYGYGAISIPSQLFEDTAGMVYEKTGIGRFKMVYFAGLRSYFLSDAQYISFCIKAGINTNGQL